MYPVKADLGDTAGLLGEKAGDREEGVKIAGGNWRALVEADIGRSSE
jgi:hypothetical protein